jgi:fatty acid desaturase
MMHHAVFSDGKTSDFLCDWLGWLAFGCFLKNTGRAHSVHHAFTNHLDLDTALLYTAPFQFHPSHASRSPAWFVRIQAYVWFGAVLPLYSLYLCLWEMLQLSPFRRVLVAVRIVPVILLNDWTIAKYALLLPWATAGYVAFISSLNHFHMDMDDSAQKANCSFVQVMANSTQDHVAGPIWDWLTGGVSRHTAHHLFPTLPNWRLAAVAADVEKLLAKHKVPYNCASPWSVVKTSAKHLHQQYLHCVQ